jgi:hypothetical protein
VATKIEKLIEQVRALRPEDKRHLRDVINAELAISNPSPQASEEDFKHRLLQLGLLKEIKRPTSNVVAYKDRKPVVIQGKPLSETLIEERR